jgi:hypothetical protein
MLSPIIYYLACSGLIVIGGTGAFYLYDRNLAQETFFNVSWELTRQYHHARHQFNEWEMVINNYLNDGEKTNDSGIEMNKLKYELTIMGYNKKEDTTFTIELDKIKYLKDMSFDLLWLTCVKKGERYFIRLDNKIENNNLDEIKKLFDTKMDKMLLQIELEQNGEKKEIQHNMKFFYFENNKVLDKEFLIWYLRYFYSTELEEQYKLCIIDSEVNMFDIDETKSINIINKDNKYKYEII